MQRRGLRQLVLPPSFEGIQYPERHKLKYVDRTPTYPPGLRPPKFQKSLRFMRGPEEIHNSLVHKQYGIMALQPGRMRYGHFEMARLTIGRRMDPDTMFAIWRVDAPWQAITKKGQGKRMGGGKGPIDHYITPLKYGRIVVEMGGHCEFEEVKPILEEVAHKLPFKAIPVSEKILQQMKEKEKYREEANINPFSFKYVVRNNMGKSHLWVSPNDRKYFGKHI